MKQGKKGSNKGIWAGRVLSGIAILFLVFDGTMKLFIDKLPPEALEAGAALQWPQSLMPTIGTTLLACTLIHLIPRTAILGAILLTGFLGGAVASHVRVSNPLFTHTLFPIYLGIFIWLGLYLRDTRVKAIFSK